MANAREDANQLLIIVRIVVGVAVAIIWKCVQGGAEFKCQGDWYANCKEKMSFNLLHYTDTYTVTYQV